MTFDTRGFGFTLDFDNGTIVFDGGHTVSFDMIDRNGEFCERDDCEFLSLQMPPDGLWVTIDLFDLPLQHIDDPLH